MPVTQALTTDSANARREPASSSSGAAPERTRLHITPFTPDLLKAFVPPSVLPQASQISYHAVQTFPDKGFGYVELPTMEAQKLKKKFSGSILKGQKVRIEDARPEKRKKILEEAQSAAEAGMEEEDRKAGKKVKKLKRKDGVLPGYELPDARHVKRGWTEPESKKDYKRKDKKEKDKDKKEKKHKSQPSKYTTDKELLFKMKLPPNAVPTAKSDKALEKPKKSKTSSRDVVVHEFSKTTKHASFLKSSQISKDGKTAAAFVEGKGWVDESGNVVEQESESQQRRREAKAEAKWKRAEEKAAAATAAAVAAAAEGEAKKSKRKSALERAEALETKRRAAKAAKAAEPADESSEIEEDVSDDRSSVVSSSSSDVSSSSDEESEESLGSEAESEVAQEDQAEESPSESESQVAHTKAADQDSIPHGNSGGDVEMIDSAEKIGHAEEEAKEVHPLEALFKRPNPPDGGTPTNLAPINTSFSFFDGGDDDDEEEEEAVEEANLPLTPYTRRDLQIRGMRSAAPTPDTAAIGKRFWRNVGDDEEDEDEEVEVEDSMMQVDANSVPIGSRGPEITIAPGQGSEETEQSEFAKHFWEHRGDYNRAWKKRRREAMKVQRQRENRRLGRKVV